ncbi:MAG: hypothetical protein RBT60_09235 [Candidatus Krumholzibacteria bacterium]|jgi:hypothetical protein|nr:hypothetical protein [Candidatus Krumholzibacteria bacterium]
MRRILISSLLLAAVTLAAPVAVAQILYGQPTSGNLGLIYTHWKLEGLGGELTLGQWLLPINGFLPLGDDLEARYYVARVGNTLSTIAGDQELDGLTDLRVQIARSLARDRYLLSAGLNLPTGKTGLDPDGELPVMTLLTQNFMQLPARRLGEGFGLNLLAGTAATWGGRRVGFSVAFNYEGAYEAYEGAGDYDPGDSLVLTAGVQGGRGPWTWHGDVAFTTHGDDQLDGRKVYSQGDQLGWQAGAQLARPNRRASVQARYLIRGRNEQFDAAESLASRLKVYGNELALAGTLAWVRFDGLYGGPVAEFRRIAGNEYGFGGTTVLGFGLLAGRSLGRQFDLSGALRFFTGNTDDGNIDLSGYQVSLSLSGHL